MKRKYDSNAPTFYPQELCTNEITQNKSKEKE